MPVTRKLKVEDIATYLVDKGWQRSPQDWHGATVWNNSADYELLLPARDGLGDSDSRMREILRCLSSYEQRSAADITQEIAHPLLDSQFFHTHPAGHDAGYTSLFTGVQTMQGIQDILGVGIRTVVQGPHFTFAGRTPNVVREILSTVELGPTRPGSYVIETRIPAVASNSSAANGALSGRAALAQVHEAVSAAHVAARGESLAAFDDAVTAGVSAELCGALSALSGDRRTEPFEIDFRWARGVPHDLPSKPIFFPAGAGTVLRAAVQRLRTDFDASGPAAVTGLIESLHDGSSGADRWRIKIRGELSTEAGSRLRSVWVRLAGQRSYDRALSAHRERRLVRVDGELSSNATGRVELVPFRDFEITG